MSNSQAVHPAALLRRLLRAQLRLKVMAGVVVVTLLALVAFDVGAVTTMRRYLLTQTDSNLHGALTLALPRLAAALAFTYQAARASHHAVPGQVARPPPHVKTPALPGAFDMTFLPFHGQQVTLQVAATGSTGGYRWILSPTAAKVATQARPAHPDRSQREEPDPGPVAARRGRIPGRRDQPGPGGQDHRQG